MVLAWELACLCICVLGCLCWLCYVLCELCVLIRGLLFYFGCCFLVMLGIYRLFSLLCVSVGYGDRFIDGVLRRGSRLWV